MAYEISETLKHGHWWGLTVADELRVKSISLPAHADGSMAEVFRLDYHENKPAKVFIAKSFDINGQCREYHVLHGKVVHVTQRDEGNSADYTKTHFYWSDPKDACPCALNGLLFRGPDDLPLFVKRYEYDCSGNPIKEMLYGNLTGKNERPIQADHLGQVVSPDTEVYVVEKSFYPEKNLLKSEFDGVRLKELEYHLDTDQIAKELVVAEGRILERHFYLYNEDLALVEEIVDDGAERDVNDLAGVTERKIIRKAYRGPHSGLVTDETHFHLNVEAGEEVMASRKERDFNQRGRPIRERYFDAENQFQFELCWDYDSHGNVIRELGAFGEETLREYDANDNLIYESGPNFEKERRFVYDRMNRLIEETECHGSELYVTSHTFSPLGRKEQTENRYGFSTRYEHDFMGRVKAIYEGDERVIRKSYHPTGYVKSLIDPMGGETTFEYTIRGKTSYAHYPDGTEEFWEYDIPGNLVKHIDPAGQTIEFDYDYKGRVIAKRYFDTEKNFLFQELWNYNAFHLLSETDCQGNETLYRYNFKGQLVQSEKNGLKISFYYNPQGLLEQKIIGGDLVERYTYDHTGKVLSETKEDLNGNTLLFTAKSYDILGRVVSETKGEYTTRYIYNSKDELIEKILPDGRSIHMEYNHKYLNDKGQKVLLMKEFDTKGNIFEKEFDIAGREVRSARFDLFGKILQQSFKTYDLLNRVEAVIEEVFYQGEKERDYLVTFKYDPMGRPQEITEEKGSLLEKSTFFEYNFLGHKVRLIKPNGVQVFYAYDSRGRLKKEFSSDKTVDYEYSYDLFSQPIQAYDRIHQGVSRYEYDSEGRILKETLATGESVSNQGPVYPHR